MKKIYPLFLFIIIVFSCKKNIKKDLVTPPTPSYKIPVYAWTILPENKTDEELKNQFENLKNNTTNSHKS